MTVEEAYIEIKADFTMLYKQVDDLKRKVEKSGDEMGKAMDKGAKWGMLATGIQSAVMAVKDFTQSMKALVGESVKGAAELRVLRSNFKGSADDMMLFKKAVAGTETEATLLRLSNKSTALGLSIKQQAIFFSVAENASDAYGGTTEENMERIIRASESGGRGLSQLGIEVKAYEQRVKELAAVEGDLIGNLDAEVQKRIKLQAILEASGVTLDDVNKKVKDEADLMSAYGVSVDEAKLKLGNLILNGLQPLLKAFDDSGVGAKNFISATVAIGSIVISAIPILVQLYSAKALLTAATIKNTTATTAETGAVIANNAAYAGNFGVLSRLGSIVGALKFTGVVAGIAAVTYGVYQLTQKINDNAAAISANRRAVNAAFPNWDSGTGSGRQAKQSFEDKLNARSASGTLLSPSAESQSAVTKTVRNIQSIRNEIEKLEEANKKGNITLSQLWVNERKIADLQKSLEDPNVKRLEALERYSVKDSFYFKMRMDRIKKEYDENVKLIGVTAAKRQKLLDEGLLVGDMFGSYTLKPKKLETIQTNNNLTSKLSETKIEQITLAPTEEEVERTRQFSDLISRTFTNGIFEGENLLDVFKDITAQIAKMAAEMTIAAGVKAALVAINPFGLFAHDGGTFQNGQKIASFAGGGSFTVPNGYSNDSYPMLVESGERVRVTPANKVSQETEMYERLLNRIESVEFGTKNNSGNSTQKVIVQGEIKNESIYLSNRKAEKQYNRYR